MSYLEFLTIDKDVVDYTTTEFNLVPDRWIIAQREHVSVSVSDGLIEVSEDSSENFSRSLNFVEANKITQGIILKNGNIVFFTSDNKIYVTSFLLNAIEEKIVTLPDGVTPYPIHTPQNALYPGMYYNTTSYDDQTLDNNIFAFVNYANAYQTGAAPLHIVYTADFGETWKVGYQFGQNDRYGDDGTASGGAGTVLGDATSSIIIRHGHSFIYCPFNDRYLCFTGDKDWTTGMAHKEVKWIWFDFDAITGTFIPEEIDFGFIPSENSRLKTDDGFFVGSTLYYASDYTGATDINETGWFKVDISDIDDITKHEQLIPLQNAADVMIDCCVDRETGYMIGTIAEAPFPYTNYQLLIAENFGEGDFAFKSFANKTFLRINSPNKKGFFSMDSSPDIFGTLKGETMMIKVGEDLFNNI